MNALSRRAALKSLGATVALPFLEAMLPTRPLGAVSTTPPVRLICVEMVHGSAGSSAIGVQKNLWAPAAAGRDFDLAPTSLRSLEPFRKYLTIVSNTVCENADPSTLTEVGGDHARSSAVFLTQAHPKQAEGVGVEAGTSLDQIYAQRVGQTTPIPSMQLCIEKSDQGGGCGYGYSCAYTDTISWASPTRPLPMVRDPRVVFDTLFGVLRRDQTPEARTKALADDRSILDWMTTAIARLRMTLGASDRARLTEYLDTVREIERRIAAVERFNASGEVRALPEAPAGVPDSFSDHVKLMFDLQVLAFASDVTRVFAFKLGRDASNRAYPESGLNGAFHNMSHHGGKESKILDFAALNAYHVGMIPYVLDKLQRTPDGDGTLLDRTLLLYGSAMGDSNLHNHKRVPFFLAGGAGGALEGGRHLKAPAGTPLANVMLAVLHELGLNDLTSFGDSEGVFAL
jgi:Protein of unknown function (DUF1552)